MELIYLCVIVGYILIRILRFSFNYINLYKLLGFKRIYLAGNPIIIKRLEPIDFIEEENGVPITLFQYQKGKTLVDTLRQTENKDMNNFDETLELAKKIAAKAIIYMPKNLKIDNLFDSVNIRAVALGWRLYGEIIAFNFKNLYRTYQLDKRYIIHVGELCQTFGKKPHEHICNKTKLTELEKYIIDEFVFNTYVANENAKAASNG